jgi:hypothetical protein
MALVIMHRGGIGEALAAAGPIEGRPIDAEGLARVIPSSLTQSPEERLNVYRQAYWIRLVECLREEYPVLAATLGTEVFDPLAADYLSLYPSTRYTLGALGRHFADYLDQSRGEDQQVPGGPEADFVGRFLVDLARYEWLCNEVFDGPGNERAGPGIHGLDEQSVQSFASARLKPTPSLRVASFAFAVHRFHAAVRRGEHPSRPEPAPTWLAVLRRNYVVRRVELEANEYRLLVQVLAGLTVEEAIARGFPSDSREPDLAIRQWFEKWAGEGFFVGIQSV